MKCLSIVISVKDVFLVDIDVHYLVMLASAARKKILDRIDLVVDAVLFSVQVAGEAAHPIIHDHDVGLERVNQVIQRLPKVRFDRRSRHR